MKKARRHAYLLLFVMVLLLVAGCSSVQKVEGGLSFPDWFPVKLFINVEMKADATLDLPGGDEEEVAE